MKLSEGLVQSKSRILDIQDVKHLKIYACQLSDISIILQMPQLEVLTLPNNQIRSLKSLKNCKQLRRLYLPNNQIWSIEELKHLRDAKSLTVLYLKNNPCVEAAGSQYRIKVLSILPQLKMLDDIAISIWERRTYLRLQLRPVTYRVASATVDQQVGPASAPDQPRVRSEVDSVVPLTGIISVTPRLMRGVPISARRLNVARATAIATAASCVTAATLFREQEEQGQGSRSETTNDAEYVQRCANLLTGALCLIREMDATTVEALCMWIRDHLTNGQSL